MNIKIEKTKSSMKHRGVRFGDGIWVELKEIAKKENVSISDVIRHASEAFVKNYKELNS